MTIAVALLQLSLEDPNWTLFRNIGIGLVVVLWLATAYWTFKDARRRISDPWLVGLATLVGLFPPFLGPIIYMFFRPPEYIQDARERELEIKAMEERLSQLDQRCPVCRAKVEASYLACPVCTTRLRHACPSCGQPVESLWQICPYCATEIPATLPSLEDIPGLPPRLGN
jgi:double zinc ribbon protein